MVRDLGHPSVVARLEVLARALEHRIGTAHVLQILDRLGLRRQRIEVDRIAVVRPQIVRIHRPDIVCQSAVIRPRVPAALQRGRHREVFSNLVRRQAMAHQPQGLVVQVAVHVALLFDEAPDLALIPGRPVVLRDADVGAVDESVECLVQVLRPGQRVPGLGTADRAQVVHRVTAVFRQVQHPQLRKKEIHLSRRFGLGRELEDDLDAVDDEGLGRLGDDAVGRDQAHRSAPGDLAQTAVNMPARTTLERRAKLEHRAPSHRHAGQDVLRDHLLHETVGGDHGHLATGRLLGRDHPFDPTVVVGMAVRIDHRAHRSVAAVGSVQRQRRARTLGEGQRVDDDDAAVALDDRHVGEIEAAHLVQAVGDFEQAVQPVQARHAPQARIDRIGRALVLEKAERGHVPDDLPLRAEDARIRDAADQAARRVVERSLVRKVQRRKDRAIHATGVARGRLHDRTEFRGAAHAGLPGQRSER